MTESPTRAGHTATAILPPDSNEKNAATSGLDDRPSFDS